MAVEIKVPSVGESISEGTIARWLKQDGEFVNSEEPLFELETEKATTEIVAPAAGKLNIGVREGQTVAIGAVVGQIQEGAAAPVDPPGKSSSRPAPKPVASNGGDKAPVLSPAARRLAEESHVDLKQVTGSGPGGRILKEDLLAHVEKPKPVEAKSAPAPLVVNNQPPAPNKTKSTGARETRQPMSAIRLKIAERLVAAQHTAAILTTFNEADMSAIVALRARHKETFQKKYQVGLGFMSFFVKATIEANDVVFHHYHNIGVAVSTEKGLMVPVLHDADEMSFAEIERQIAALAQKAREGKIRVDDLQGGTFTITNGGTFGSLLSTPILNPPQSAILGMHAIQKRPVVVDDQIVVRPMMYLALSYDHRLIDGREAVQFLVRVKECLENPERLLLEV
jgi:2-oxoglutarate dehydrogenase E2 component (dihydrolipoamide succinyltransferase)